MSENFLVAFYVFLTIENILQLTSANVVGNYLLIHSLDSLLSFFDSLRKLNEYF